MSNHTQTIVPIEAWAYSSPWLQSLGKTIDVGLLLEALIYYDRVLINPTNPEQFAQLLRWFVDRNEFQHLMALFRSGELGVYDYSFITAPVERNRAYDIINVQDPIQERPSSFEERYLYHKSVGLAIPRRGQQRELYNALRKNVIEAKAKDFSEAIDNARADARNPDRFALTLQVLVDEAYSKKLPGRKPPVVTAQMDEVSSAQFAMRTNVDLDGLGDLLGPALRFNKNMPLTAIALCNRFLLSSARTGCDLYLGTPISSVLGDKLYESASRSTRTEETIGQLQANVEFPDVRKLVNEGQLNLKDVLSIRAKSKKFRQWLQAGADRDRDAIVAYHNEVAHELGMITATRKMLGLFGYVGAPAIGAVVAAHWPGAAQESTTAAVVGGVVGGGAAYLAGLALHLREGDWKPVVFGIGYKDRIAKLLAQQQSKPRSGN